MSVADLMRVSDPMFDWMHSIEHNNLFWTLTPRSIAQPSTVFTPMQGADVPSGLWQFQHQIVHDNLANDFNVQPSFRLMDEPVGSLLWTFWNYREHSALNGAALVY